MAQRTVPLKFNGTNVTYILVNINIKFLCVQEDLEQQKLFRTQLEVLEKQTQNIQNKLKASLNDTDSVKVGKVTLLFPINASCT